MFLDKYQHLHVRITYVHIYKCIIRLKLKNIRNKYIY